MSVNKKREYRRQAQIILTRLWPAVFDFDAPKPLKVGIRDDMMHFVQAQGIPLELKDIRACLRAFTMRISYQKCLIKGEERFDLNGEVCGIVTEKQKTQAKTTLVELYKRRSRKKKLSAVGSEGEGQL